MSLENFALNEAESEWWDKTIKKFRKKYIKSPREYVDLCVNQKDYNLEKLKLDVETLLIDERETIYRLFLKDESVMNAKLVTHLIKEREFPNSTYEDLLKRSSLFEDRASITIDHFRDRAASLIGDFTGEIFPYLYALSLSSTNSRRARAGGTFEMLIEKSLDIFSIPYQNQSSLGTKFYDANRIGKKVDLIIPGRKAYEERRTACGIVTAKTTLRERWQEVVEELNRSNVRHIYLATLDETISDKQVKIMKEYNITLVVRKSEKSLKFSKAGNVESFETFFNVTIPHLLEVWPDYVNE